MYWDLLLTMGSPSILGQGLPNRMAKSNSFGDQNVTNIGFRDKGFYSFEDGSPGDVSREVSKKGMRKAWGL